LSKRAESILGRHIGLQEFGFKFSPNALEESRLSLSTNLSRLNSDLSRLKITYSSTLQLYQEQRLEIEYPIKKNTNIAIIGEKNEEGRYGADIKLEFELK
jgi:hypothetical protein